MRRALAQREEQRTAFTGTFVRLGTKRGWEGRQDQTVLLAHIRDQHGNLVCDHLWFNLTKQFAVAFVARVKVYWKGYQGRREEVWKPIEQDYKLSHPTQVRKVTTAGTPQEDNLFFALDDCPAHAQEDPCKTSPPTN
jgi:hypothetical protein